jgi:hypothetical protein
MIIEGTEMDSYQSDIVSLVAQLEKLMKVINHSDPSAKELKHLLYQKYQQNVTIVAERIKGRYLWEDIKKSIYGLFNDEVLEFEDGIVRDKILKKLLKDFEEEFVSTPNWQEFSEPDPIQLKQRIRNRQLKKSRKQDQQNEASVKLSYRQRHAKGELQKVIDAINRIDPKKLEKKISKITRPPKN